MGGSWWWDLVPFSPRNQVPFAKYEAGTQLGSSGPKPGGGGGSSSNSSTSRGGGGGRSKGWSSSGSRGGRYSSSIGGGSRQISEADGGGGIMVLERGGGAACPLVTETPPTPSALLAEAREEADEAADSLPSGATGSCTGSGIRGGLPRVAEAGAVGALMLFRDRVPVRDSCVLRSLIPWPMSSRQPKLRGLR